MAKRQLQEINAGSMADIAFLLLIFFLVTTTMDSDTGLLRKLPPIVPPDQEIPDDIKVKERNILQVKVNKDNLLLVEGELIRFDELRAVAKEFMINPNEDIDLPEKINKDIPFFGLVRVTESAVISLQNDIGTKYGMYIAVQNELMAARNELRNTLALTTWGVAYDDLDEEKQAAVDDYYNVPISEAEPKKIGGK